MKASPPFARRRLMALCAGLLGSAMAGCHGGATAADGGGVGVGGGGVTGAAGAGTGGAGGVAAGGAGGGGGAAGTGTGGAGGVTNAGGRWVLGYWAVWQATQYPLDHVAWSDLTHVALSFVLPREPAEATSGNSPYATLDSSNAAANLGGAAGIARFASTARAGGTRPLISLGGAGAGVGFAAAASAANRGRFVADVVAACAAWGYDGVDLDWEDAIVYADFQALVLALRAAAPAGFLITAPVGAVNLNLGIDAAAKQMWTAVAGSVDQINVMTYTGSGAYPGWVVWHLDALLGNGPDHPVDVASSLAAWAALGIPKAKLGAGIGFYGRAVSAPVTAPLQSYGAAAVYENDTNLSYGNIKRYFEGKGGAVAHWDATAMTGWLSWPSEFHPAWTDQFSGDQGPATQFLTYEDPQAVAAKGAWLKQNGYGGVIIWTINEGTQYPYGADGYANPLLDATAAALR